MSDADSGRDRHRRVVGLGIAALGTAVLSYAFAWYGGLWAVPVGAALALGSWRRAMRAGKRSWSAGAGVVSACVAVLVGAYAFASTGGVQPRLRTDAAVYAPADVADVRLKAGIRPVGYNLCSLFVKLEHRDGDEWRRVPVITEPVEGRVWVCTEELRGLAPLLSTRGKFRLPRDLPPGSYRLVHEVEVGGDRHKVATSPFRVTTMRIPLTVTR